jgi:ABC-type transporter Mla subunit MlaD
VGSNRSAPTRAYGGNGPRLRRLIDAGGELLGQAEEVLPETVGALRDGETLLDAQRASEGHLKAFARQLAGLTDSCVKGDGTCRT